MKQRGFIGGDLLLWAVIAAAILAALYAIYHGIDSRGYARGAAEIEGLYRERDNEALRKANAARKAAEDRARALERKSADDLAAIGGRHQKEIEDARVKNALLDADLRTGALRLRVAISSAPDGDRGCPAAPGAPAGERDGPATAELHPETARALVRLTDEADDVARQLASAQQVILKDREICR